MQLLTHPVAALLLQEQGVLSRALLALFTPRARTLALLKNFASTLLVQEDMLYSHEGMLSTCRKHEDSFQADKTLPPTLESVPCQVLPSLWALPASPVSWWVNTSAPHRSLTRLCFTLILNAIRNPLHNRNHS